MNWKESLTLEGDCLWSMLKSDLTNLHRYDGAYWS